MRPVAAIPINDINGVMFPHLEQITADLKQLFSRVYLGVSVATQQNFPEKILGLQSNPFFEVMRHQFDAIVGEDFLALYLRAASLSDPDQIVHLCFTDRVAFALQSDHRASFMADIHSVKPDETPLIFQRSELAWQTHPSNYRVIEGMVTTAGELLIGKSLDFAWCHLAVRAGRLMEIIPTVKNRDISFMAELVLAVRDEVRTKDVDWLAWEDPFILSQEPQALKEEREESIGETKKRLGYVIPMLELLVKASQ